MTTPRDEIGNGDMLDLNHSGYRDFQEMLDEKLRDLRNWTVQEHQQRLQMLQSQHSTLKSLLALPSKPAPHAPTTPRATPREQLQTNSSAPTTPRHGPRILGVMGCKEVGCDSACEDFEADGNTRKPSHQNSDAGSSDTRKPSHHNSFEPEPLPENGMKSPLERWNHFVQKMNSPEARIKNAVPHSWHLHHTWLAATRLSLAKHETGNQRNVVITAFERLDSCLSRQQSPDAPEGPVKFPKQILSILALLMRFRSIVQFIWNLLSLLLVLYEAIMIPVLTFFTEDVEFAANVNWFVRIFWTLDFGLHLLFSNDSSGNLVCCRFPSSYLKSWFGFDFIIVLSDWLLLLSETGSRSPGAFLRVLRIGKLLRISRLVKVLVLIRRSFRRPHEVEHDEHTITIYILEAFFAFAIAIHVWACVWYGVGNASSDGWAREPMLESSEVIDKYLISLAWAASQIHGATGSDSFSLNTAELAFSTASMFIGFVMFTFLVGRVANAEALRFRIHLSPEKGICEHFCNENHVSSDLHYRALRYLSNNDKRQMLIKHVKKEEQFLASLPKSLRMDMKEQMVGRLCMNIEFFKALSSIQSAVLRKVCEIATSVIPTFADEVIFSEGDTCGHAYIVQAGTFCYKMGHSQDDTLTNKKSNLLNAARTGFLQVSSEDDKTDDREVCEGRPVSEAVFWTNWVHAGTLFARAEATLLAIKPQEMTQVILERKDSTSIACHYAARFVSQLNEAANKSDLFCYKVSCDLNWQQLEEYEGCDQHFAFLSHFKAEAGTEATLMHADLQKIIFEKPSHPANKLLSPVFLDSSDLTDLKQLRAHVEKNQNLIVLLTPGILSRPWCVLEICVAVQRNHNIVPVEVQRPGLPAFQYPREDFYQNMRKGGLLGKEGMELLREQGFEFSEVEAAIRHLFMQIALPFSPHKSEAVRQAELSDIFARCTTVEAS